MRGSYFICGFDGYSKSAYVPLHAGDRSFVLSVRVNFGEFISKQDVQLKIMSFM